MSETMMTEAQTPTEGAVASTPDAQAATAAVEGVQQQSQAVQQPAAPVEKQPEAPQLPESYEFTAPEGVEVFDGAKEVYAEVAKELGLTQEQAQAAYEKLSSKGHASQVARVEAMRNEWAQASTKDAEFGGEKLQENLVVAQKALTSFGSPALRQLLNESGLGNHPEIIRAFYKVGKATSEDAFVSGVAQGRKASDDARGMYPASNMNP